MAEKIIEDRYLGDGVYASFDGYHIVLDLRAQEPTLPITRIALEPAVLDMLGKFQNDVVTARAKWCLEATGHSPKKEGA